MLKNISLTTRIVLLLTSQACLRNDGVPTTDDREGFLTPQTRSSPQDAQGKQKCFCSNQNQTETTNETAASSFNLHDAGLRKAFPITHVEKLTDGSRFLEWQ